MTEPVVTVTLNPAIDQTVWIPGFRAGAVNRVAREEHTPGGKGVNVAAFLAQAGVPAIATGLLGAPNAALFEAFFARSAIEDRFVRVDGITRTGVKIVDEDADETTDINFPGFTVGEAELAALERTVADLAAAGRWVALAGSLPPGAPAETYGRLASAVHAAGGRVAVDTSGPALAAAVGAHFDLAKPNRAELEELTGRTLGDRAALVAAARDLAPGDDALVAVSLGADGALFVQGGEAVFAAPPPVRVASTVGAGDAMVAGTITGLLRGLPLDQVAALATAFSATAIGVVGPHLDPGTVARLLGEVRVEQPA